MSRTGAGNPTGSYRAFSPLGKGFLAGSAVLLAFSWSILMSLNVTFSNVRGIILKEWKGCSEKTIVVLLCGLVILVVSCFFPQLL